MNSIQRITLLWIFSAGALGHDRINPRFDTLALGPCVAFGDDAKCSTTNLQFHLYTRVDPERMELVEAVSGYSNITSSTFNPAHPTKIIIHGYNSGSNVGFLAAIKTAYFNVSDFNVFMVEWSELAKAPCYPIAATNARYVGRCIGELVLAIANVSAGERQLMKQSILNDLHVIGFSLGAQVAAFVSDAVRPFTLPRITGLDPALPFFLTTDPKNKLDPSDAEFVDVIHTNAMTQGQMEATGHVDFYMNGGYSQPGCGFDTSSFICNHHRSVAYFTESILTEVGFWGWPCYSWFSYMIGSCSKQQPVQLMGEFTDKSARGVYFVDTASESPFALGKQN